MLDLVVRNATLADGRRGVDVGVQAGRIAAVEPRLQAEAGETIDAGKVIAESAPQRPALALRGRPPALSFSWPPPQ